MLNNSLSFNALIINKQQKIIKSGGYLTALFMLTIPFSTTAASILPFIIFFLWLISRQFLTLPQLLQTNPVTLFAFLLISDFVIGMSYGSATISEAYSTLGKYRELLLIIFLIPFLRPDTHRRWTWNALVIASIITLISSYAMYFELIEAPHPEKSRTSIKTYITHSLFIAFFAFYCAHKALRPEKFRFLFIVLILFCAHNIFFVVEGRTGQLIFILLTLLFTVQRLNKKGIALSMLVTIIFLALFFNYSDKAIRFVEGFENMQAYLENHTDPGFTSMGQRLTYWSHSLQLIEEKPWFGHGTGSFSNEYLRIAPNDQKPTSNPHNEYLMITVQLGIVGLILFLGLLISQYICSLKLTDEYKWLAQGILLALAINSMVNSSLLDHTEGHWFACLIALCFATLAEYNNELTDPADAQS